MTAAPEPAWALCRPSVPLPRLARGEVAAVDLNSPYIKRMLSAQWLVPLPAAMQPALAHDPMTGAPKLALEGSDAAPAEGGPP